MERITKKEKVKKICIGVGAACVVAAAGYCICRVSSNFKKSGHKIIDALPSSNINVHNPAQNPISRLATQIDEDIFTDLAPRIESAVLKANLPGFDSVTIDRWYDISPLDHVNVVVTINNFPGD